MKRLVVTVGSLARGFAVFWWEFLVGDTPELFIAVVALVAVGTLVSVVAHAHGLGAVSLVVLVVGALALSLRRAAR